MEEPELLKVPAVAKRLGLHVNTVRKMIRKGIIPVWEGAGTIKYVRRVDLERLLESASKTP
jgi:excisionase family DNA binding protein